MGQIPRSIERISSVIMKTFSKSRLKMRTAYNNE